MYTYVYTHTHTHRKKEEEKEIENRTEGDTTCLYNAIQNHL